MSPVVSNDERVLSELSEHQVETLLGASFGKSESSQRIAQRTFINLDQQSTRAMLTGISTCGDIPPLLGTINPPPFTS